MEIIRLILDMDCGSSRDNNTNISKCLALRRDQSVSESHALMKRTDYNDDLPR
jgi:hypothetical protein